MATEADHLKLANKNHDVLLHLLEDVERFPEWVTVTAFYKAVQIIEAAYQHKYGHCSHGRPARLQSLKNRGHETLYLHYRALWAASSVARYLHNTESGQKFSSFSDYIPAEQVKKLVKKRPGGIECESVNMLSDAGKTLLIRLPDVFR